MITKAASDLKQKDLSLADQELLNKRGIIESVIQYGKKTSQANTQGIESFLIFLHIVVQL